MSPIFSSPKNAKKRKSAHRGCRGKSTFRRLLRAIFSPGPSGLGSARDLSRAQRNPPSGDRVVVARPAAGWDSLGGWSIDRHEWELVERWHFPGPLGHYYAPDGPDTPDVFAPGAVPQYRGGHGDDDDDDDDALPPPYEWARLSSLPLPVRIDESWSSLFAAQREKSRLLDTERYIAGRIREMDNRIQTVMDEKLER